MSTYSIKVNCSCGKILKVPEKYAGKRVKCPCERKISIPTISEIKKKIGDEKEELRNCPTCGAFLNKDDVICVACRMNLQTGEWDNSNPTTYNKPKNNKLQYFITAAVVFIVVTIGIGVISTTTHNDNSSPENMTMIVGNDEENATKELTKKLEAAWESLANMPEDSSQAIDKKMDTFAKKIFQEHIAKSMNNLENKKYELMAKESHDSIKKDLDPKNPILEWYTIDLFANKFEGSSYVAKTIKAVQEKNLKKVFEILNNYKQNIEQAINQGKYKQALINSFLVLSSMPFSLKKNPEVQVMLTDISKLSQFSISKLHAEHNVADAQENTELPKIELLEKEIANIRIKINTLMSQWKYTRALELVEPLAIKAETFRSNNTEEISYILTVHDKLINLSKLWTAIEQGIEFSLGKTKRLFLYSKTNSSIIGKINKYKNATIYMHESTKKETTRVEIKEIKAEELVNKFALESDYPKEYVYSLAIYFYRENNLVFATRDAGQNLKKPTEEQNKMIAWAKAEIDSKKQENEKIVHRKQEADEERTLQQEEGALAKSKQRAWSFSQDVVKEYNRGNFEKVLDYLQIIKNILPRGEVKKMSKRLGTKQGYTLKSFAEKALNTCRTCTDGSLECRTCFGAGKVTKTLFMKTDTITKTSYCRTCKGKKRLKCPTCSKRRFSKPFGMLVAWYSSLH